MGRATMAYAGTAVAALGLAASFVASVAGALIAFVGGAVALMGAARMCVPSARLGAYASLSAYAYAVFAATGAPLLGLAAVLPLPLVVRGDATIRLGYKGTYAMPLLFALAVALTAWQWPGLRGLVVAPGLLFSGYATYALVGGVTGKLRRAAKRWAIAPGDEAPDFELPDGHGQSFRLADERGRFVLLMFLTSEWCPLCHVKMRVYQRAKPELERAGVKVVAVWGSPAEVSEEFVRELGLEYVLLSDVDCAAARRFGAIQDNPGPGGGLAPRPSFFLIGPDGRVRLTSRADDIDSYLDPEEALKVVLQATDAPSAAA